MTIWQGAVLGALVTFAVHLLYATLGLAVGRFRFGWRTFRVIVAWTITGAIIGALCAWLWNL